MIVRLTIFLIFAILYIGCSENKISNKTIVNIDSLEKLCTIQIKTMLKDPDSYQSISWIHKDINERYYCFDRGGTWYNLESAEIDARNKVKDSVFVRYELINKYRAKNSFGGYGDVGTAYFLTDSSGNIQFERNE